MRAVHRIGSAFEALLLAGVGVATLWIALGDRYAVLMNPKFRALTVIGGAVVLTMGLVALLRPRRPSLSGIAAFLALVLLVLVGRPVSEETSRALMVPPEIADLPILEDPEHPLRELREVMYGIEDGEIRADGFRFTAMGQLHPLPGGEVALLRNYMVCCIADALVMGFVVSGEGLEEVGTGEWVVVSGQLTKRPEPRKLPRVRIGTTSFPRIDTEHDLLASRVVRHRDTMPTLWDQLGSDSLTRYREAVEAAGLVETLEGPGPFTVFAPIDAAFGEAGVDPEEPDLSVWVARHIVEGEWSSRSLYSAGSLRTIRGEELTVRKELGKLRVGRARLVFKDIRGRNGVVHLVYPRVEATPPGRESK